MLWDFGSCSNSMKNTVFWFLSVCLLYQTIGQVRVKMQTANLLWVVVSMSVQLSKSQWCYLNCTTYALAGASLILRRLSTP